MLYFFSFWSCWLGWICLLFLHEYDEEEKNDQNYNQDSDAASRLCFYENLWEMKNNVYKRMRSNLLREPNTISPRILTFVVLDKLVHPLHGLLQPS